LSGSGGSFPGLERLRGVALIARPQQETCGDPLYLRLPWSLDPSLALVAPQ
jgi:hypothetical protein